VKFRRQRTEEINLNLTPLIDIVFLLLIFFMVSTTFTKETHLAIDLPEASGASAEPSAELIEVVISADGRYALNGKSLVNNQLRTLMSAIETLSGGDSQLPLIITADARTPHESVVRAMDAAGQLGFVKISITTRRSQVSAP
jgi:biopolymer transport protein ExbD